MRLNKLAIIIIFTLIAVITYQNYPMLIKYIPWVNSPQDNTFPTITGSPITVTFYPNSPKEYYYRGIEGDIRRIRIWYEYRSESIYSFCTVENINGQFSALTQRTYAGYYSKRDSFLIGNKFEIKVVVKSVSKSSLTLEIYHV